MTKKLILYLLLALLLAVALLIVLGLISPSAVAPGESTFQGPPPGSPGGFRGPTGPPPSGY